MNVKNNIKKVSAVLTSAALVATTFVGALAYDLSDYPAPFVEDGMAKAAIVVGANAATQDVIGAIDIAASLQAEAKSGVSVGGNTVSVEGAEDYDELELNAEAFTDDAELTETKLDGFVDSDFDFNDADVDYSDSFIIKANRIVPATSLEEEDFGSDVFLQVDSGAIEYRVYFDDAIDQSAVSDSEELEFDFLGQTLTITDVKPDNVSMDVESSQEFFMQEGDSVTVGDSEVTLVRVGESSVLVNVDGQTLAISHTANNDADRTEEFDQADDFEVRVESAFYIEGAADNSATLRVGGEISELAEDGEPAEMFGQPSERDEADWLWDINFNSGSGNQYVGLVLNINRNDLTVEDNEDRPALAVGESIDLPNGYASLEFTGLEVTSMEELTISVLDDISKLDDGETNGNEVENVKGVLFETDGDFLTVGTEETSKVWVIMNSTTRQIWYEDGDDEILSAENTFSLEIDNEAHTITPPANVTADLTATNLSSGHTSLAFSMAFSETNETLYFFADADNDFFGVEDDNEAGELWLADATSMTLGTKDYDIVTQYGVHIENPEDQFGSGNSFSMMVPSEQQKATIVVRSEGSVVSASASGEAYNVNPIALGLGVLDTDAPALGSRPMIIVGGPAANTVAAEFMGNPTAEQIAETFSEGKALIQYNDDNMAMLVAGWGAMETQGAANVVAKFGNYDFEGTELEVTVTDLSNIEVSSVN